MRVEEVVRVKVVVRVGGKGGEIWGRRVWMRDVARWEAGAGMR